jgi:sugar phosphate isomerase/epimerase
VNRRPAEDVQWVLWSGTVGLESPLLDRFPAATAGGFGYLSLSPLDVARSAEQGLPATEIKRRADDRGLGLIMDPVMNWHPATEPSRSRFARFSTDEALRMSEAVGAVSMTAIASSTIAVSEDALIELFGTLCDRAADIGALVHLEFIPMTGITDVATAWSIVRQADRPNGGILFDTWHFFRGSADFDDLEAVPGERIFAVQVDDGRREVVGSLWDDTQQRLLPGDGCFDLPRALRTLVQTGGLRWVGPEVISPETAAMPAGDAARLAGDRVRTLVADALETEGMRHD